MVASLGWTSPNRSTPRELTISLHHPELVAKVLGQLAEATRARHGCEVEDSRIADDLAHQITEALKPEAYEHLVTADKNGMAHALCGKSWRPDRTAVRVVGKCPNCEDLVTGGWVA